MEEETFRGLATIMARLAAGDRAAVFTLYEQFGANIARMLRAQLRRLGVHDVSRDELDGLVIDACMAIFGCAAGWDPDGGALPWTWAQRRIANVASAWVGLRCDEFDSDRHDHEEEPIMPVHGDSRSETELLTALAERHTGCALLLAALDVVASPRDRQLVLELHSQAAEGDPSPAVTVGRRLDMAPDAVRQASSRVRRRLRELAASDGRFASLGDIPLVA